MRIHQSLKMSQEQRMLVDEAAKSNDIEALYRLLREDPYLLENIDKIPFADTPLHVAAASGSTHFAVEVLSLKPSLGKKLSPDGFSPIHVALLHRKTQTVRRLMECDSKLIRVKGKGGCTPLHHVAEVDDDSELLAQFLVANEKSIKDLNIRKETVVHVAVRSGNLNAFKVLLRWMQYNENFHVLNWKDEDDNTALHIAVATHNYKMVRRLTPHVRLNMLNQDGLTALDIAMGLPNIVEPARKKIEKILRSAGAKSSTQKLPPSGGLVQYISEKQPVSVQLYYETANVYSSLRKLSDQTRSNLFVVAGLVIAATYQAVLSPPGGLTSADDSSSATNGTSHLPAGKVNVGKTLFLFVYLSNSVPFLTSMAIVILLLPKSKFFVVYSLPLVALSASYGLSTGIISPAKTGIIRPANPEWVPLICGAVFGAYIFIVAYLRYHLMD